MEKDNKHVDLVSRIIREIVMAKEETEKEMVEEMDEEVIEKMIKDTRMEKNRVEECQKNIEFFKVTLDMADSLIKTIDFAERKGKRIGCVSMSGILTGMLVVLEKRGFVKIIEKE